MGRNTSDVTRSTARDTPRSTTKKLFEKEESSDSGGSGGVGSPIGLLLTITRSS